MSGTHNATDEGDHDPTKPPAWLTAPAQKKRRAEDGK